MDKEPCTCAALAHVTGSLSQNFLSLPERNSEPSFQCCPERQANPDPDHDRDPARNAPSMYACALPDNTSRMKAQNVQTTNDTHAIELQHTSLKAAPYAKGVDTARRHPSVQRQPKQRTCQCSRRRRG